MSATSTRAQIESYMYETSDRPDRVALAYKGLRAVLRDDTLSRAAVVVFSVIAESYVSGSDFVRISATDLAEEARVGRTSVFRALDALEAANHIERYRTFGGETASISAYSLKGVRM